MRGHAERERDRGGTREREAPTAPGRSTHAETESAGAAPGNYANPSIWPGASGEGTGGGGATDVAGDGPRARAGKGGEGAGDAGSGDGAGKGGTGDGKSGTGDGKGGNKAARNARDAYDALVEAMGSGGENGFSETSRGGKGTAWPTGQAAAAALDLALTQGNRKLAKEALEALERFERKDGSYDARHGKAGDRFYDDNAWIGLDLMQAYRMWGDEKYLHKAKDVFRFLQTGFAENGGVMWKENWNATHAASTGPTAQLALALHEATGEQQYLETAKQLQAFTDTRLRGANGTIADYVTLDGHVYGDDEAEGVFSYNQGTAIGADVQLYRATGDAQYLERAKHTASAAIAFFSQGDSLWKQPPSFNAIFFRNLLDLDAVAPDPQYRQMLESYLKRADSDARKRKSGLYGGGGIGKYGKGKGTSLIDQAAFTQMWSLLDMNAKQLQKAL
jgi:hypothetical protein